MTLKEFLLHHTQANELCAIGRNGWIIGMAWIDHEDRFIRIIPSEYANTRVRRDSWGTLPITKENGERSYAPCHYIDIE